MFNITKKINFKKLLGVTICLVAGLVLSSFFAWQTNLVGTVKHLNVNACETESVGETNASVLTVGLDLQNPNGGIQLTSSSNNHEAEDGFYTFDNTNVPTSLQGGTRIWVDTSDGYKIVFDANGDGDWEDSNEGYATITISEGHKPEKVHFGNNDEDLYYLLFNADNSVDGFYKKQSGGSYSPYATTYLTTEEIDPNYTGTIKFRVTTADDLYSVDFFYKVGGSYIDEETGRVNKYTISDFSLANPITDTEIAALRANTEWVIKASYVNNLGADSTITFTYNSSVERVMNGIIYYPLTGISGYGNFIDGDGQTVSDPTIVAFEQQSYTFTIVNEDAYWSDLGKPNLSGVAAISDFTTSPETNPTEVSIPGVVSETNSDFADLGFYSTGDSAFELGLNGEDVYRVFNYGFRVTGYNIYYLDNKTQIHFSYKDGSWSPIDPSNSNTVEQLANTNFGSLAEHIDKNTVGVSEVYIVPKWEAVEIALTWKHIKTYNVVSGGGNVTFGQDYTLIEPTSIESGNALPILDPNGQTFFRYYNGDNYIANSSIWNYTIFEYTCNSGIYSLDVTAGYLDNIYKITFNGIAQTTDVAEGLNGDYTVAGAQDTIYAKNYYTYKTTPGLDAPDETATDGLADNASISLTTYSKNYVANVANSSLYHKLYGAENAKYTYILNDSESEGLIGTLPAFSHNKKVEILWKTDSDNKRFKSAGFGIDSVDCNSELGGKNSTQWILSDGQTLYPIYVYAVDGYYENTSAGYSIKEFKWYSKNIPINTLDAPTTDARSGFIDWMLDAGRAKSQGYSDPTNDTTNKTVELTRGSTSLKFKYTSYSSSENRFYGLTQILSGEGVFTQTASSPIILARFNKEYTLIIDNSSDYSDAKYGSKYWSDLGVSDKVMHGAVLNGTAGEDGIITLDIGTSSTYKFQTSINSDNESVALYSTANLNELPYSATEIEKFNSYNSSSAYYYVYNYGFYIKSWKISYGSYVWNGMSWSASNTGIVASNLSALTFGDIAKTMNTHFPTLTGKPEIKMTPVWEGVKINVKLDGRNVGTATYGSSYELKTPSQLSPAVADTVGKTFYSYKSTSGTMIATKANWNYKSLGVTNYEAVKNYNEYNFAVDKVELDNIYKLTLNNVISSSQYELENTDFEFSANGTAYTSNIYDHTLAGTVVNYSATDYPLVESYVSDIMNNHVTSYNALIDSNHEIFKKVYYSRGSVSSGILTATNPTLHIYLAHNKSTGRLPMFKNDYAKIIIWDYNDVSYKTSGFGADGTFNNELQSKVGSGVWNYQKDITGLNAVCAYRLDIYYEDNNASDGVYSSEKSGWFAANTDFTFGEPSSIMQANFPTNKTFEGWMVNKESAGLNSYTASGTCPNLTLTKTGVSDSFVFEYTSDSGNMCYGVAKVKGNAIMNQSTAPIVLARFSRQYSVEIDASTSNWSNSTITGVTKSELYGAISNTDTDDDKKVALIASKADASAYPFQTSVQTTEEGASYSLVFYKKADYTADVLNVINSKVATPASYYCVYNYGHQINGWIIEIKLLSTNETKYLSFNGTSWSDVASSTEINANNLTNQTFREVAAYLDVRYDNLVGCIDIKIKPVWGGAYINLIYGAQNKRTVQYFGNYSITPLDTDDAVEFVCYKEETSNTHFVNNGTWNYLNIDKSKYIYQYDDGTDNRAEYNLAVVPVTLNNIFKVTFSGVEPGADVEDGGAYAVTTDTNSESSYNYSSLITLGLLTAPVETPTNGLYDQVSSNISTFVSNYSSNVKSSRLYRKIFSDATSKYTYLLHEDEVGVMPRFKNEYKQEILWYAGGNYFETSLYSYNEDFYNETNNRGVSTVWVYSYGQTLSPICVYKLDLYYEDNNPNDGVYSTEKTDWFGFNSPLTLSEPSQTMKTNFPTGKNFEDWTINKQHATTNGYTSSGTLKLTKGTDEFNFVISSVNGDICYGVTEVSGKGILSQTSSAPIILARFSREYKVVIDSSDSNWSDKDVDKTNFYGAISDSDTNDDKKVELITSKSSDYAYPFLTTNQTADDGSKFGLAFYKKSDYSVDVINSKVGSLYYYVYNYGHQINGWTIEIKLLSTNETKYLSFNGSNWSVVDSASVITSSNLTSVTFTNVATYLDSEYEFLTGLIDITITPSWGGANIRLLNNEALVKEVVYYSTYNITAPSVNDYEEFVAYKEENSLTYFANNGRYNYINIAKDDYVYDSTINKYNLAVEAVTLYKLFKITFDDTASSLEVEDWGEYSQAATSYNETSYSASELVTAEVLTGYVATPTNGLYDEVSLNISEFVNNYEVGVKNSPLYHKVFSLNTNKHTYLLHEDAVGILPVFKYSHQQEILWHDSTRYFVTIKYDPTLYSAETNGAEPSSEWTYISSAVTTFDPIYRYRLDMYYEDEDSSDGIYSIKPVEWYGIQTPKSDTFNEEAPSKPTGYEFASWMFNSEMARSTYGYTVVETGSGILKVTYGTTIDLTFTYDTTVGVSGKGQYNSNLYYKILSVQGKGVLVQDRVVSGVPQPIVLARYGKLYEFKLDNSNNIYWKNIYNSNPTLYADFNNDELYGAYASSSIRSSSFDVTVINVANKDTYAYPFQTNEYEDGDTKGFAFFKKSDYSKDLLNSVVGEDYYYLYQYGHYITGWYVDLKGEKFVYSSGLWEKSNTTNLVANLSGITFKNVAEFMDEYAALLTGTIEVKIVPVWQKVKIDVHYDGNTLLTTGLKDFGSSYTLKTTGLTKLEEKLIAFEYNSEDASDSDFIAVSADWNYCDINNPTTKISSSYVYTTGSVNGGGTYTLNVTPVYIDNIFKVELAEPIKVNATQYQLVNTDYIFNKESGSYNGLTDKVLTIEETSSYTTYANYQKRFVDMYITRLIDDKETYVEAIETGSLEILRKVYYSNASNVTNVTDDVLTTSGTPTMWTYLANEQDTGKLPMFENDYNIHIFWQNYYHADDQSACPNIKQCVAVGRHYLYIVGDYSEDYHSEDLKGQYLIHDEDKDNRPDNYWKYSDGYNKFSPDEIKFVAKYFRSYYFLNIRTLVDNAIERRGYVKVDIEDDSHNIDPTITCRDGHYIVIAKVDVVTTKMVMQIYEYSGNGSLKDLTLTEKPEIRIYNGSTAVVGIYDQSKDNDAMDSGNYDDMIGYKFSGTVRPTITYNETTQDLNGIFNVSDYIYTAVVSDNIPTKSNSTINFDVPYEKLAYKFRFEIDNTKAGEFNLKTNSLDSGYKTSLQLENIKVGNRYELTYYAFAGFKLNQNAFVYYNGKTENTLLTYDDSTIIDQNYVITGNYESLENLDGTWLRNNFYSSYTDYSVSAIDLGKIRIFTDEIEFDFYLAIYDETNQAVSKGIIETLPQGKVKFPHGSDVVNIGNVGDYLTESALFGLHYHSDSLNKNYALLSSRMLIPSNLTSTNDNFYTTYGFLLEDKPTSEIILNPSSLAFLVQKYEDGKIISSLNNNRTIALVLEVREIYTVTMQVLKGEYDTNDTTRTVYLRNSTNNNNSITINSGAGISVDNYYYIDGGNVATTVTTYTYHGLTNTLSATFDETRYTGFDYYLNNNANAEQSNDFVVLQDRAIVTIQFNPNVLDVEYVYMLNGVDTVESDVASYIEQIKPNVTEAGLKVGDSISYYIKSLNENYDVKVLINQTFMGSTNKSVSAIECIYTVNNMDFELKVVEIRVEILPRNNAGITINYALIDSSKKDVDDVYGTFEVYVDSSLEVEDADTASINIYEGRNVSIKLDLNKGYHYVGIRQGVKSIVAKTPDQDGKILIIEDFDVINDAGDYTIVIDKDIITATLDTSTIKTREFKSTVKSEKPLNSLYIGSVVTFTYNDVNKERLDSFFIQYDENLTEDIAKVEDGKVQYKITPSTMENIINNSITFGVRTVSRYKLITTVSGQEYLEEEVKTYYLADSTPYIAGTYCDEGTQLTYSVKPNGVSLNKFKYDIAVNGTKDDDGVIEQGDNTITLNSDINCVITITPKVYDVIVSENLYQNLEQINTGIPESVITGQVNKMDIQGSTSYNSKTTLEFVRVAKDESGALDRELSAIYISDNDGDEEIVIEFNGVLYVAKVNGVEVDLASYGYSISIGQNGNSVKLEYTTFNDISITLNYKSYKTISSG